MSTPCPTVEKSLHIIACKSTSCFASSRSIGSSKYLLIDTSSLIPFLLRVLTINSLASAFVGAGSKGRRMMDLSRGSPGTMFHVSNVPQQNACPCVWYLYTDGDYSTCANITQPVRKSTDKNKVVCVSHHTQPYKPRRPKDTGCRTPAELIINDRHNSCKTLVNMNSYIPVHHGHSSRSCMAAHSPRHRTVCRFQAQSSQ